MTKDHDSLRHDSAFCALSERCRALGLPVWLVCVDTGAVLACEWHGPIGAWMSSEAVCEEVLQWALGFSVADVNDVSSWNGAWLLPMCHARLERHRWLMIALANTDSFEPPYASDEAKRAFASTDSVTQARVNELHSMLGWMAHDQTSLCDAVVGMNTLTERLSESFEEANLLYQLADAVRSSARPDRLVEIVCGGLSDLEQFAWASVAFSTDQSLHPALCGKVFMAGDRPAHDVDDPETLTRQSLARALSGVDLGSEDTLSIEPGSHQTIAAQVLGTDRMPFGVLIAGRETDADHPVLRRDEVKVVESAASSLSAVLELASLYNEQREMFFGVIKSLSAAIDAKDPYTRGHSERVAMLSRDIARAAGMTTHECERIHVAGLVHDVGKIGVPEAVLCKPGRLTDEEFELIRAHPEIGYSIMHGIPHFSDVLPGVLYHHERYDGCGYPHKLAGEEIPLMARVIGLADAFDAMSSTRTYRSAMTRSEVLSEITRCRGIQFDPALVDVFLTIDLSHYDEAVAQHEREANAAKAAQCARLRDAA